MDFLPADLRGLVESYWLDSPGKGKPSLAVLAGLGQESKCDYFAPLNNRMLVIEDTKLVAWMKWRDKQLGWGLKKMADEFVAECRGKMDGSVRILGALYAKFIAKDDGENSAQAECEFWVVATDIDAHRKNGDVRAYDALTTRSRRILRDGLRFPYVFVDIVGAEGFADNLRERIPQ